MVFGSHIGNEDNELADVCAKSAVFTGTQINNLIFYKEVYNSLNKEYS